MDSVARSPWSRPFRSSPLSFLWKLLAIGSVAGAAFGQPGGAPDVFRKDKDGAGSRVAKGAPAPPAEKKGASPPTWPQGEIRAMWVTRWDFKTEADVRKIVAGCAALGLNVVVFQVRGQADAFYRSNLEPWGEELEGPRDRGGDPGFDPLAVAIDEAHARGLALVAWANVLPGWKGASPPSSRKHLVHAHPDWFLTDQAGRRKTLVTDRYALVNPCRPEVRAHIAAVLSDIGTRYPIDGLQIDYIRFLDRDLSKGEDVPYDPATIRLFRKEAGAAPKDAPDAWDGFRRQAVDRLVAEIAAAARAARPGLRLSVAAIRDASHARAHLFQDAADWKRRGWVEDVYPMNYERDLGRFRDLSSGWTESCGGPSTVMGIGVHLLPGAADLQDQVRALRTGPGPRPAGYCLFALSEFFTTASREAKLDPASAALRSQLRMVLAALNRKAPKKEPDPRPIARP
jgi:uncharacterized lipoprotein YddW (UPF0748 family)